MYIANFYANYSTRWDSPVCGTNKNKLIKAVRQVAAAERLRGNMASWYVAESIGGDDYKIIAAGFVYDWGFRHDPESIGDVITCKIDD